MEVALSGASDRDARMASDPDEQPQSRRAGDGRSARQPVLSLIGAGGAREVGAARGQAPRVRGPSALSVVRDQLERREPAEELGYLALVGDAGALGDLS